LRGSRTVVIIALKSEFWSSGAAAERDDSCDIKISFYRQEELRILNSKV
jgi:hypothetical protein